MEQKRKTEYKVFFYAAMCILSLVLLAGLALTGNVPGVMSASAKTLTATNGDQFTVYATNNIDGTQWDEGITSSHAGNGGTQIMFPKTPPFDFSPDEYEFTGITCSTTALTQTDGADFYNFATMTSGQPIKDFYVTYNYRRVYQLPETPTKEGHTFIGWFYDEACTQPYDGNPIYEETTFYAGWTINRYTVTFDSNGGVAVDSVTVDWNTAPDSLPAPEREGHTFIGWFDGDTPYIDAPITADKTLTAHWEINTYTVTFMVDGEVYKTITVDWGTSFQTVLNANGLTYFNVYSDGVKMSKATPVKEDITVELEAMSAQEKRAEFFAKNWWVLLVAGGALVIGTAIVVSAVKRKRR